MALPIPAEQSAQVLGLTYGTTKLLLLTEVKVSAGINIEQITSDNIKQTATGVVIQLPAPKILTADLDAKKRPCSTTIAVYSDLALTRVHSCKHKPSRLRSKKRAPLLANLES